MLTIPQRRKKKRSSSSASKPPPKAHSPPQPDGDAATGIAGAGVEEDAEGVAAVGDAGRVGDGDEEAAGPAGAVGAARATCRWRRTAGSESARWSMSGARFFTRPSAQAAGGVSVLYMALDV